MTQLLNNSVYILLALLITTTVAFNATLTDKEQLNRAVSSSRIEFCTAIKFDWIRASCYRVIQSKYASKCSDENKDRNECIREDKRSDFYFFLLLNLSIFLGSIFGLKIFYRYITTNYHGIIDKMEAKGSFLEKITNAERNKSFLTETWPIICLCLLLIFSAFVLSFIIS